MAHLMRTSNPALNEKAFKGQVAIAEAMTLQGTVIRIGHSDYSRRFIKPLYVSRKRRNSFRVARRPPTKLPLPVSDCRLPTSVCLGKIHLAAA